MGIVHPKMINNLLTLKFLHTYMTFFLLLNTNKYILKNGSNQTVMVPIDFHSINTRARIHKES